jgi:hypothetical protein
MIRAALVARPFYSLCCQRGTTPCFRTRRMGPLIPNASACSWR